MPKDHKRKQRLNALKEQLGVKHSCAVRLLDHDDAHERSLMIGYLDEYVDVTSYDQALDHLRHEQNNPLYQVMCTTCGWTNGMVCPECWPGCGCSTGCTGWRHAEFAEDDPDHDPWACEECGAGGRNDPYGECCCYDDEDDQAGYDGEAA